MHAAISEPKVGSLFPTIEKAPTGIAGLDEITRGGLPARRSTLVCGGPGCGKTVLAMEFLVRGAQQFGEPGLFVSFEEKPQTLVENFRSFGFDLNALVGQKQLAISHIDLSHGEIIETGEFTLTGLLIRLEYGIKQIGAKRVVLDTMETRIPRACAGRSHACSAGSETRASRRSLPARKARKS